jgi:hypothetical protein
VKQPATDVRAGGIRRRRVTRDQHRNREVRVKEAHQEAALANPAPNLGKEVP